MFRSIGLVALALAALPGWARGEIQSERLLSRIAVGSCADQKEPQPVWHAVLEKKPDLLLLLGDNVYAKPEDPEDLRKSYRQLASKPLFRKVRRQIEILAIWDDHDYGKGDGGRENPIAAEAQAAFLDFFEFEEEHPIHQRTGVYQSYIYGPVGKRVQIIMLDTRRHRGPLKNIPKEERPDPYTRYVPNDDHVPVLGEAQWTWLEEQLKVEAEIRLICSGIQILPHHFGERWGNFPHERSRLLQLFNRTKAAGVILLSGDQHLSEIMLLKPWDQETIGYPLYELTASGLNRSWGKEVDRDNDLRLGRAFGYNNFGQVLIDWNHGAGPMIQLQVLNESGQLITQQSFALSLLKH